MPDRKINVNRIAAKAQEIKNPKAKQAAEGVSGMVVWDSEEYPAPVEQSPGFVSFGANGWAFVVQNYPLTGSRTAVVLFGGPHAQENMKKWDAFVQDEDRDVDYINDTEEALKECCGGV